MENKINFEGLSQDEIIFIDRNKAYGAYDLRQSYNRHVKRAILSTVLFAAVAIGAQNIYASRHIIRDKDDVKIISTVEDIKIIEHKVTPPPPPAKTQMMKGSTEAATRASLDMKPTDDAAVPIDTAVAIDPEATVSDINHSGKKDLIAGTETGTSLELPKAEPPKEPQTVSWAEVMPKFPGGDDAMMAFVRHHLVYPDYEKEIGVQGKAVIGFVVNEYGKVTNVHVIRGVSQGIDRESMRVISALPDFTPGMQGGRQVRVNYVIPMDFRLKTE